MFDARNSFLLLKFYWESARRYGRNLPTYRISGHWQVSDGKNTSGLVTDGGSTKNLKEIRQLRGAISELKNMAIPDELRIPFHVYND
jgi:hypothetical protein